MDEALGLQGSDAEFGSQKPRESWAGLVVNGIPKSMTAEAESLVKAGYLE